MEQDVREMMEIDTPQGKACLTDRRYHRPPGQQRRHATYRGLQDRRYSQDSRKYRTTVYSRRQPSQLYFPDVSVRRHPLPQAIAEGSPFPALHPPGRLPKATPRSSKWERHDNPRYRSTTSLSSKTSFANGCTDSCRRYSAKKKHSAKQRIPGNVNIAISAVCVRDKKQTIRS